MRSHTLAGEAVRSGLFDEQIVPLDVKLDWVDDDGEPRHMETTFERDEGPRTPRWRSSPSYHGLQQDAPLPPVTHPRRATGPPRSS